MSAPLKLTPDALSDIAGALRQFNRTAKDYNVEIGSYGSASITHTAADGTETVLSLSWDHEDTTYIIDDRIGD